jgi:hypothetical protein
MAASRRAASTFVIAIIVLVPLGIAARAAFDDQPPDPDRLGHGVARGLVTGGILALVLGGIRIARRLEASPVDTLGALVGSVLAFMSAPPTWAPVLVVVGLTVTLVATRFVPGRDAFADGAIIALATWLVVGWTARHPDDALFVAYSAAVVVAGLWALVDDPGARTRAEGRWLLYLVAAAFLVPLAILFSIAILSPIEGRRDPADGAGVLLLVTLAVLVVLVLAVLRGLRRAPPGAGQRSVVDDGHAVR